MPESLIYPPSTPSYFHNMNSFPDNLRDDGFCMGAADVTYPVVSSTHSMLISNNPYLVDSMIPDGYALDFQNRVVDMDISTENISHYLKDPILNVQMSPVSLTPLDHSKRSFHQRSSAITVDVGSSGPTSLVLPDESMEVDNELGVFHLLMAYAEAVEMMQDELSEVIVKRIGEKVSPVGDTLERLIYYMFQTLDKQSDYLRQESFKNFYPAFKAFYQIFPNGKFAHFAANSAILEALPNDIEVVRIFDFDIGEGIQWGSMIESIAHKGVQVLLTSVKFNEVESNTCTPIMWRFEDTKRRLFDYARLYGLKLKVEEIELSDLEVELKNYIKTKEGIISGRREFYVFNCMSRLPHMGRPRQRKEIMGFLQIAQSFLKNADNCYRSGRTTRGIITLGDGDAWEKVKTATTYNSFLDGKMTQYQALLESIKMNFPTNLGEARTAMECLFVAPLVSSAAWAKEWEDAKSGQLSEFRLSLEGWEMSQENLMEAKHLVKEGESLYEVRIEGERSNELVMEWRGVPLVTVSCWTS